MTTILNKSIGPVGFGLMGFTWRANQISDEQAFEAMRTALRDGANFWNGGLMYGTPEYNSLHLLNRYFTKYPEDAAKVVLSIKAGMTANGFSGAPDAVDAEVERAIGLLDGKKSLDLFQIARVDPKVPIEETVSAIYEHVKKGRIGGISLSEVSAQSIRRAAKVAPISAVEVELSLYCTEIFENGVAKACAELNIPIIAYSPLGRGFLTGSIRKFEDIPAGDRRQHFPRFQPENFESNLKLADAVIDLAKKKGCTPAQLAIGWVLAQSGKDGNPVIIPIPGATTSSRVEENLKVYKATKDDTDVLDGILKTMPVLGGRYPDAWKHLEFA